MCTSAASPPLPRLSRSCLNSALDCPELRHDPSRDPSYVLAAFNDDDHESTRRAEERVAEQRLCAHHVDSTCTRADFPYSSENIARPLPRGHVLGYADDRGFRVCRPRAPEQSGARRRALRGPTVIGILWRHCRLDRTWKPATLVGACLGSGRSGDRKRLDWRWHAIVATISRPSRRCVFCTPLDDMTNTGPSPLSPFLAATDDRYRFIHRAVWDDDLDCHFGEQADSYHGAIDGVCPFWRPCPVLRNGLPAIVLLPALP